MLKFLNGLKKFFIIVLIMFSLVSLNIFYVVNKKTKELNAKTNSLIKENKMMKDSFYAIGGAVEASYEENKEDWPFERLVQKKIKERGISKYNRIEDISYPLNKENSWVTMEYGTQLLRGNYISHNGTDMNSIDLRVFAVKDATVDTISYSKNYGNYIILSHEKGKYLSLYAHLSKVYVEKGQKVSRDSKIGIMGDSGDPRFCTAVHLHFIWAEKNKRGYYRTKNMFSNSNIRKYYIETRSYSVF
jgi:murein DD-endopeptidase MepM/ murein hydrolase activator NlpD